MPLCASVYMCLWSPARKGLTSRLSFVVSNCEFVTFLSHWYPGSGVVLDCIDSLSLHPYLLISILRSTLNDILLRFHSLTKVLCLLIYVVSLRIRTSNSLNEGLPIKMTREKFQRKRYFFSEKDSRFNPRLIHKAIFSLDKFQSKNMGRKLCFCYSTYRK